MGDEAQQRSAWRRLLDAHIDEYIGNVEVSFVQGCDDGSEFDVHIISPMDGRDAWTLVTTGISDAPMDVTGRTPKFAELILTLPRTWHLSREAFEEERWFWPVRLLCTLAAQAKQPGGLRMDYLHDQGETFAPSSPYSGALLFPSMSLEQEASLCTVNTKSGPERVGFYSVYPLYPEEVAMGQERGPETLTERFDAERINDIMRPQRTNVGVKRWGL